MFGLLKQDIEYILTALNRFEEIEKAFIFGSRAIGNYKRGSDIDIAISGEKITPKTIYQLSELLNEEYPLPYYFDIIHYEKVKNEKLVEHIKTYGKELYRQQQNVNEEIQD